MISFIKGKVVEVAENLVVLECNNVGYNLIATNDTVSRASMKSGEDMMFYAYLAVREDAMTLYGFYSKEEKAMFEKLITVSGIGPKVAIGILSGISPEDLGMAIISQDISKLTKIKGLGKKTAERVIVELKEKVDKLDMSSLPLFANQVAIEKTAETDDAIFALCALGLANKEAVELVAEVYKKGDKAEDIIKNALKNMRR